MQAFGPAPPLLSSKGLSPERALAIPGQDWFQACLQGRLVNHLTAAQNAPQAGGAATGTGAGVSFPAGQTAPPSGRPLRPERYADLFFCLVTLGVPPEQARTWLKAAAEAGGTGAEAEPRPFPPLLSAFLELMDQSPGQALKIPPSRRPEVTALLRAAGLPQEQVDRLLNSPTVQEQGLTSQAVKAAWTKCASRPVAAGEAALRLAAITDHPAYRRLWDRLAIPQASLPDLREAWRELGLSLRTLAGLEEQARSGPLALHQIVKMLRQPDSTQETATAAEPASASGGAAPAPISNTGPVSPEARGVEAWLKLLTASGLPPAVAQTLLGPRWGGPGDDLKARLASLEPPAASPAALDAPKPLYLTPNLRLRVAFPPSAGGDSGRRFLSGQEQGDAAKAAPGAKNGAPPPLSVGETPPVLSPKPGPAASLTIAEAPLPAAVWEGGAAPDASTPAPPYLTPQVREALWSQIQAGVMSHLRQGENRVSLNLNPPELGTLQLTLNLKGRFVEVVAVAARPEVAHLAAAEVQHLVQAMNQQGLILSQFQVQVQEPPGRNTVLAALGHREQGRREAAADQRGAASSRRRTGQVDFFV